MIAVRHRQPLASAADRERPPPVVRSDSPAIGPATSWGLWRLPEHPTTRPLRQTTLLQLQRAAGNDHVQRLLAGRSVVQRCGGERHAGCPCAASPARLSDDGPPQGAAADVAAGGSSATVRREPEEELGLAFPGDDLGLDVLPDAPGLDPASAQLTPGGPAEGLDLERPLGEPGEGLLTQGGGGAPPSSFRTIRIWLNAFIPRNVPGVSKLVPAGPHAGKTMLPGPTFINDCFLTDQRDFDTSVHPHSRMHSAVELNLLANPVAKAGELHDCSPTHEVDCEDGEEECNQKGTTSGMSFSGVTMLGPGRFSFNLTGAANNPCFTGSPDIDYVASITVDLGLRMVVVTAMIDAFPAYELYAAVDGGAPKTIFQVPPPPGNTPGDLFGPANRPVVGVTFF